MHTFESLNSSLTTCPFCGGAAELKSSYDVPDISGCWVECKNCPATVGLQHGFDTQEQSCGQFNELNDAVSAWNQRKTAMHYIKQNLDNLKSIEDLLNFMKDGLSCDWQEDPGPGIAAVEKALTLVQELDGRLRLENFIDSREVRGDFDF